MTPFNFQRPESLHQASNALAQADGAAKVMAGGQSLLLALKERQARPSDVVAIGRLPEMRGIAQTEDGRLSIGAATTYKELAKANLSGWRAELCRVAGRLADRSVRSLGTIGGAVCQADPRFDMPVLLSGMGANFRLVSARGERSLAAAEFFNPAGGTQILPDEILCSVLLPRLDAWHQVAFEKFSFRTFEAAIVTAVGAFTTAPDGTIERLCLVVGGVAKAPAVAAHSAASFVGRRYSEIDAAELATQASREVLPPASADTRQRKYQSELAISLMKRVLSRLQQAGPGQQGEPA